LDETVPPWKGLELGDMKAVDQVDQVALKGTQAFQQGLQEAVMALRGLEGQT